MLVKSFDRVIRFTEIQGQGWRPILTVTVFGIDGHPYDVPLLFGTGASQITLPPDYDWLFPAGTPETANVGGQQVPTSGTLTRTTIEFLGRRINCPVLLLDLPTNPAWAGLFGGPECLLPFGFGVWQSACELYVSLNP